MPRTKSWFKDYQNQTNVLNERTFYYLAGRGCWVAMWGDSCGCNQEMYVIPANVDGSIGTWDERYTPDDASPGFIADAERLVMGPYIK